MRHFSHGSPAGSPYLALASRASRTVGLAALLMATGVLAQDPKGTVADGYAIHQSMDIGGRIVETNGSNAMYDTLVNLQSGPRILSQYLEMRTIGKTKYHFFDTLMTSSTGLGGDPINVTTMRMSKGKIYDFQGLFRRDRQYFDYNLLDNPLVPAGVVSNGYTFPQVLNSPHLFNTVRRMTDVTLTILPISRVTFRAGYSQNINQGPSYSSIHYGTEALLFQNWRVSTDNWMGAIDWKPLARTSVSFEEYITHYKGNTSWEMAGLNLQLSNGVPVSIGFDNVTGPTCTGGPAIASSATNPATANENCNGFLQYNRDEPTRALFPTEEFRFQSAYIKNLQMNGRVHYTSANMNLPQYFEYFNGNESRTKLRASTVTGYSNAERVNVSADFGAVYQVTEKISLSEQYDFWDFRQPGNNYLSEVDQAGTSMLVAPGAPGAPAITSAHTFLGQKTEINTVSANWQASSRASLTIGYRYRYRLINRQLGTATDALPDGTAYTLGIHENGGLLGAALQPTSQWRINGNIDFAYADRTYTQISPRALQHYQVHSTYKPKPWATISGTFNDLERHNNVLYVGHQDHSRSASAGASLMPNEHFGVDLSYGYLDVYSVTGLCYVATPAPDGAVPIPAGTGCGTNVYLGTGYYNAPSQYGSFGLTLAPIKALRSTIGYRISSASGAEEALNPRLVAGSLASQYSSPYATLAWTLAPGWAVKGDWNYYGYGEGSPVGPTSPRAFHSNICTLAVHYDF